MKQVNKIEVILGSEGKVVTEQESKCSIIMYTEYEGLQQTNKSRKKGTSICSIL